VEFPTQPLYRTRKNSRSEVVEPFGLAIPPLLYGQRRAENVGRSEIVASLKGRGARECRHCLPRPQPHSNAAHCR